jgi:polyisoprenyl-phosphate glycosyltransferase
MFMFGSDKDRANQDRADQNRAIILIPLFNDWEAAGLLLKQLDETLESYPMTPEVLLVDDGSTQPMPPGFPHAHFKALRAVEILRLRRNIGHQRAIAVGLVFLYENRPCRAVIVMDADGEDQPSGILPLTEAFYRENQQRIVFAARSKRLERLWFRSLYKVYRMLHLLVTGDPVRVGNFSIVPSAFLSKLVVIPEIWNHYAAAVIRTRIGSTSIPVERGRRLTGESRMNFIALLLHGLRAFFVYGEVIGARLLVAIACLLILGTLVAGVALAVHFTTSLFIPGLFLSIVGALGIILLQAVLIALILVFSVIGSNGNMGFLPLRDCHFFVDRIERLFPASGEPS